VRTFESECSWGATRRRNCWGQRQKGRWRGGGRPEERVRASRPSRKWEWVKVQKESEGDFFRHSRRLGLAGAAKENATVEDVMETDAAPAGNHGTGRSWQSGRGGLQRTVSGVRAPHGRSLGGRSSTAGHSGGPENQRAAKPRGHGLHSC